VKLSASVLAKLCALGVAAGGCETAYLPPPNHPGQVVEVEPDEAYVVDPRLETIETTHFARPPGVAPVEHTPVYRAPKRPPPPPVYIDNCPACGMG